MAKPSKSAKPPAKPSAGKPKFGSPAWQAKYKVKPFAKKGK